MDFLPEHLVIVGGSYVGLEFGQMHRRFGSEVTIVEMASRLIQRDDEDVPLAVQEILENEGVNVRLDSKCIGVEGRGERVAVKLDCESGAREVAGLGGQRREGRWVVPPVLRPSSARAAIAPQSRLGGAYPGL